MPRHLPLRYGLRGMLVVVTCVCLWLGHNVRLVQQRRTAYDEATVNQIWSRPAAYQGHSDRKLGWLRRALGDRYCDGFVYTAGADSALVDRLQRLFPEARMEVNKHDTFVESDSGVERVFRAASSKL